MKEASHKGVWISSHNKNVFCVPALDCIIHDDPEGKDLLAKFSSYGASQV